MIPPRNARSRPPFHQPLPEHLPAGGARRRWRASSPAGRWPVQDGDWRRWRTNPKHESDRAPEQPEDRARASGHFLGEGQGPNTPPGIEIGKLPLQSPGDTSQLEVGRLQISGLPEPPDRHDEASPRNPGLGADREGLPEILSGQGAESGGHDADDNGGRFPGANRLPNDRAVRMKPANPDPVAQKDRHWGIGNRVFRRESPAQEGLDAEYREQIGRNPHAAQLLGGIVGNGDAAPGVQAYIGEHPAAVAPEQDVGRGKNALPLRLGALYLPQRDQPIGVGVGKRPQQNRIEHAPESGGRTQAERQREGRRDGKSGTVEQGAPRESKVAEQPFEPAEGPDRARSLPEVRIVAEPPAGLSPSNGRTRPVVLQVLRRHRPVDP